VGDEGDDSGVLSAAARLAVGKTKRTMEPFTRDAFQALLTKTIKPSSKPTPKHQSARKWASGHACCVAEPLLLLGANLRRRDHWEVASIRHGTKPGLSAMRKR
jgi:hypothetical protein